MAHDSEVISFGVGRVGFLGLEFGFGGFAGLVFRVGFLSGWWVWISSAGFWLGIGRV
jgi:hypothetical protein